METDVNEKGYKQDKSRSLSIRMPLYSTRTKRGWNGKRREERWSTSNTHAMARDRASKEETRKRIRVPK
jgi:hypothetical protein